MEITMPTWSEILHETTSESTFDISRRKYLQELYAVTKRNVIVYYSGWLQKPGADGTPVTELDKNAFMAAIHGLDRSQGLDLLLPTEGGETAATESLVYYLRQMFGTNIRAIIPQIAMSAGTMIALSCKEIVMGKHSSLGPIDPQLGGMSAHAVVEEFNRANLEVTKVAVTHPLWQLIIGKYPPTLIGECEKAIQWGESLVRDWLSSGMFEGVEDSTIIIDRVIRELGDHAMTLSHSRRITLDHAKAIGLRVVALEDNQHLQEAVMSVHHTCMITLERSSAFKLIENHNGVAYIRQARPVIQGIIQ